MTRNTCISIFPVKKLRMLILVVEMRMLKISRCVLKQGIYCDRIGNLFVACCALMKFIGISVFEWRKTRGMQMCSPHLQIFALLWILGILRWQLRRKVKSWVVKRNTYYHLSLFYLLASLFYVFHDSNQNC
jgi:hypothetical protein